ncbi:MAG: helix-turn-helix transcriptional regulator [Clostridia bacterium]|jgi:transcriptional regulator with XRE-family HTH domain|nr:helix-turn-helix transcriptional regulator [Clostridia bacterium]
MENYKSFGAYLKALRAEKALTVEEIAEKMKIKIETVKKWERNLEIPTLDDMYKLSELYQVPCEHLLRLKDDLFKPNNKTVKVVAKICRYSNLYVFNWMESPFTV